ncbi:DNA repair protein RadC [Caulobacter sp. CCNWLY153]|uniref:MPN domain-containing protein n=1 Tax=Caulobacter radicis TaxID=2172650 RepID=A0A2T9JB09_9CAUL|nr:DNA repair protein RadC [Caulobacter radicis]PVM79392.1 hypothetical protein DDF65_14930 [Caulobacter radicis]PVM83548.1 hypothetical protein DDF62_24910 [Caulobacter radicis]
MSASPALTAVAVAPETAETATVLETMAKPCPFTPQTPVAWAPSRQKVLDFAARFGVDVMQDAEILHLHLAPDERTEGCELAVRLVERFGGLAGVLAADRAELRRHVGEATILNFKILREAAGRVSLAALSARPVMSSFGAVAAFFRAKLRGLPREEIWAAFLDRKNQLILAEALGKGTVDHAPVYVREVLRRALETGASALVLAHNHPSGDPTPSKPDIEMTRAVASGGKALGVLVHDHLIVGAETVASFRTLGLL